MSWTAPREIRYIDRVYGLATTLDEAVAAFRDDLPTDAQILGIIEWDRERHAVTAWGEEVASYVEGAFRIMASVSVLVIVCDFCGAKS